MTLSLKSNIEHATRWSGLWASGAGEPAERPRLRVGGATTAHGLLRQPGTPGTHQVSYLIYSTLLTLLRVALAFNYQLLFKTGLHHDVLS